ncbi:Holliday junction branch migration protein RuvA [Candidatus Peregrinibacteria bacterium]|nr:Holliday junction branch migration protein RuvA [Candidatus Peregrinibacteria bacterium]
MISYLSGLIIDKDKKSLTVLTGGIGYRVYVTTDLLTEAKEDQKIQLYIHTSVREDDISLYGFQTKEELMFYEQLLNVSGIGPKMALDILTTPIAMTKNAILSEDIGLLTKIKGLGKKTAERLCLELKNKIEPVMIHQTSKDAFRPAAHEDAVLALESLGYERYQILKFVSELPADIKETEDIVKSFLKTSA